MKNKIIRIETAMQKLRKSVGENDNVSEYVVAVQALNSSMATIMKNVDISGIVFNTYPQHYSTYQNCQATIVDSCTKYTQNVYSQLVNMPNNIIYSNSMLSICFNNALTATNKIIGNVDEGKEISTEVAIVTGNLKLVETNMKTIIDLLTILLNNLNKLESDEYEKIVEELEKILNSIVIDSGLYLKAKKELENTKKQLEEEIKNQTKSAVASGVTGALVLIAGTIAVISVVASGGTATPIILTGVSGFITLLGPILGVSYSAYNLVNAKKELEKVVTQLSQNETDSLLLEHYKESVKQAKEEMENVKEQLQNIKEAWEDIYGGYMEISNSIEVSYKTIDSEQWEKLADLLKKSVAVIEDINETLDTMKLDEVKYVKADISIGMSEEEVAKVLELAPQLSFIEYMLAI